jgi:YD repeat-containing protein
MPKTDLQRWDLVGPVRTLWQEFASWDRARQGWEPPRGITEVEFLADGHLARTTFHNPDGSLPSTVYTYDAQGRLVEIRWIGSSDRTVVRYDPTGRPLQTLRVSADGSSTVMESFTYDTSGLKTKVDFLAVPGDRTNADATALGESELFVNVPGAVTATTIYDARSRPVETRYHDASHLLIHTATVSRDREGHVTFVESRFTGTNPMLDGFEQRLASLSEDDRQKLTTLVNAAVGDSAFITVAYEYDQKGRAVVKTMTTGALSRTRTTFVYDAHDNPIEQEDESSSHRLHVDDSGEVSATEETVTPQRLRFEYVYDDRGNWTERVSSVQSTERDEPVRSDVERRRLTYWPS